MWSGILPDRSGTFTGQDNEALLWVDAVNEEDNSEEELLRSSDESDDETSGLSDEGCRHTNTISDQQLQVRCTSVTSVQTYHTCDGSTSPSATTASFSPLPGQADTLSKRNRGPVMVSKTTTLSDVFTVETSSNKSRKRIMCTRVGYCFLAGLLCLLVLGLLVLSVIVLWEWARAQSTSTFVTDHVLPTPHKPRLPTEEYVVWPDRSRQGGVDRESPPPTHRVEWTRLGSDTERAQPQPTLLTSPPPRPIPTHPSASTTSETQPPTPTVPETDHFMVDRTKTPPPTRRTQVIDSEVLTAELREKLITRNMQRVTPALPDLKHQVDSVFTTQRPPPTGNQSASETAVASTQQCYQVSSTSGYTAAAHNILQAIDMTADPCHDFYAYACAMWPLRHPLPESDSKYSVYKMASRQVADGIEQAIASISPTDADPLNVQLKQFYDVCLDVDRMDREAAKPLLALLADSSSGLGGGWPIIQPDSADVSSVNVGELAGRLKGSYGVDTLLFTYATNYELNSSRVVLQLSGSVLPLGLGVFKQQYYGNDSVYWQIMDAYELLIYTVAQTLVNETGAQHRVDRTEVREIVDFEKRLAALVDWSINNEYSMRMWPVGELKATVPDIDWDAFFHNLLPPELRKTYDDSFEIELSTPVFVKKLGALLRFTQSRIVHNYCIWRLVKYSLFTLGRPYRRALQAFNAVYLGTSQARARSHDCIELVRGRFDLPSLDLVTARVYINNGHFGNTTKRWATGMTNDIAHALQHMISNLTWMDDATKTAALRKAGQMKHNVAYPDWLFNETLIRRYYEDFPSTHNTSLFALNLAERAWACRVNMQTTIRPFDHGTFGGPPTATDAWYSNSMNAISIPAGELQPPFYQPDYPPAVDYGAAGAVIGHEMSHAFDQTGSAFDADGNLKNWWSKPSRSAFQDRLKCLISQYNGFCVDGLGCVDGASTASENMADLAGLKSAYLAFKTLNATDVRLPLLESFTPDQVFFLSYASFWCGSQTRQAMQSALLTDHHAPDRFRVIGVLQNMPQFSAAFHCPAGSYMNPVDKCSVW